MHSKLKFSLDENIRLQFVVETAYWQTYEVHTGDNMGGRKLFIVLLLMVFVVVQSQKNRGQGK